ncbi:GlxA family transcriptional regulator [Sedimentitalea sp. XS_ASV28]|uniref:GlxA family transcriptional regulator n=1 Tax=Sedimentitalea sp. XS_ASV28 TaxID=3241296 RepID=UPI0035166388
MLDNMPANPAKNDDTQRLVLFVVFPGITLLDLSGPLQVLNHRKSELGEKAPYKVVFVSNTGGTIETDASIQIETDPLDKWIGASIQTLITVGGTSVYKAIKNDTLINGVTRLAETSDRICSVCSGAFVLAAAGLLNGRNAVTHWEDCEKITRDFPDINVNSDAIFLRDGNVWTSAGCSTGIDLALALVSEDLGHAYALEIARSIVAYMVRPGGQLQFSAALQRQTEASSNRFDELNTWILENLGADLRNEVLAERVNMSPRNFSRAYVKYTGHSPAKAVELYRIEAAQGLLETSKLSISSIADRCGFKNGDAMRRSFLRNLKVAPSDYRSRFEQQPTMNFPAR